MFIGILPNSNREDSNIAGIVGKHFQRGLGVIDFSICQHNHGSSVLMLLKQINYFAENNKITF